MIIIQLIQVIMTDLPRRTLQRILSDDPRIRLVVLFEVVTPS